MIFNEKENKWLTSISEVEEVNLSGTKDSADAKSVSMLNYVEANYHQLLDDCVSYINEIVANPIKCKLDVQFIDIGLNEWGEHSEFEIFFTAESDYLLWSVRFSCSEAEFRKDKPAAPFALSRRNW
ncbi:hypothetical protein MJO52_06425 [Microbulbifer variabilis]|uniref:Uncharacterized protein n=1 Tax=Microbulbifer variabilis TaxID=266805 RepID=A0ABY4VER5_9GAMM|nr:hypothetical protein [Microbulbifer variabilis]USD22768.1 hypothetical protein MJO52_06425 [Microbulbifer variabilis]